MKIEGVLEMLERRISRAGSAKVLAKEWNVSEQYLCDVRNGRRNPGDAILSNMGLRKEVLYWSTGDHSRDQADMSQPNRKGA